MSDARLMPATRTSCDTEVPRSPHPPAHRPPPGTRSRRLPRTRAQPNGTSPCGMSQPHRVAGRAGTQEHRDRPRIVMPGASRPALRCVGRESPNPCWVQPPLVGRADTEARSPQQRVVENVPTRSDHAFVEPTKAVGVHDRLCDSPPLHCLVSQRTRRSRLTDFRGPLPDRPDTGSP